MKRTLKLLVTGLLLLSFAVAAVGCGGGDDKKPAADGGDQPKQPESKKRLVVGTNATFPPFESMDKEELVGFDMDLIRAIGAAEGYEVEIQHMEFKSLIPALQSDKIDCAIAGMSVNEERKEVVDFSEPYFDAGLIVAVPKANPLGIQSKDDLKGKRIAAQTGTTGANACQQISEADKETKVSLFKDIGEAFMEMDKGGVDAVVNDQAVTLNYITTAGENKVITVGEPFSTEEQYAIAVKKDNADVLKVINSGLKKVKENGEFDQIYKKWIAGQ